MKLYLSSHDFGEDPQKFVSLFTGQPNIAVILNAQDYLLGPERKERISEELENLRKIGIKGTEVDLRDFKNRSDLMHEFKKYNGVWVMGGNVFLLRRMMSDSAFDIMIKEINISPDFVYGGYSAGSVVAGKTLEGFELVDDVQAVKKVYGSDIVWEGLGLIDYSIAPHYRSGHEESDAIENVVNYLEERKISYKTLQDGQVIIINKN
ncbi:MAG: Type 1 glutamine amidotransferase-like domain-containing protein [Patescibacteria group bacterium]